jgi:hypothetical protein
MQPLRGATPTSRKRIRVRRAARRANFQPPAAGGPPYVGLELRH